MKDIGSIYPLASLEVPERGINELPFVQEPNVRYYSLCREALSVIARQLNRPQGRVLIPAYTCQTVITPFVELGWTCHYYGITENLRIDCESLRELVEKVHPDVIVVHPYYGRDLNAVELTELRAVKETCPCVIIEDLTQCLFSRIRDNVFDFYVGSLRKWFPIPDGGFLFSSRFRIDETQLDENVEFVSQAIDAMYLRGCYYSTGDVRFKDISRRIDKRAGTCVVNQVVPHAISSYSRAVLSSLDLQSVAVARMRNFQSLIDGLRGISKLRLLDSSAVTSAPLYCPVFTDCRGDIQQKLIANQIYAPILWPIKTESVLINPKVKSIYDQILAIPCDQRYSLPDMGRVIGCLA